MTDGIDGYDTAESSACCPVCGHRATLSQWCERAGRKTVECQYDVYDHAETSHALIVPCNECSRRISFPVSTAVIDAVEPGHYSAIIDVPDWLEDL